MYDSSLKYKWDNKNVRDYAMKEGMEKGVKIGIEKGEHKKALEIACACKKNGMSTENIARVPGFQLK